MDALLRTKTALASLAVLAAVALTAVATAHAAAPDFGHCVKVAGVKEGGKIIYHGTWVDKNCTKESPTHTGHFEWEPGVKRSGFSLAIRGVVIEQGIEKLVKCTSGTGSGTITGLKTVGGVTLKLIGCEDLAKHKCSSSGLGEGEMQSAGLEGELGKVKSSTTSKVGVALSAVPGSPAFMAMTCGSTALSLQGTVIANIFENRMLTVSQLHFAEHNGEQNPEKFEGGTNQHLTLFAGAEEQGPVGLGFFSALTYEETLEVNGVA